MMNGTQTDASWHRPILDLVARARHGAKKRVNFRAAKRIMELAQSKLTNSDKRKERKFDRDIQIILQDDEFRKAMKEYIDMGYSLQSLEDILGQSLPSDVIPIVIEYGRKLPKTSYGGRRSRKTRKGKKRTKTKTKHKTRT